jgi:hypothetical protein
MRRRRWDAAIAEEPQSVVFALDQPANGRKASLVLEAPIEDLPAQLVPPVRPDVVHGEELREQVSLGLVGHPQPQRGRTARPFQPDRPGLEDRQSELVVHGRSNRIASLATDVQMRGLAGPIGDEYDVIRREQAEPRKGNGYPQR